ncbi:hypothetical protein F4779DRAFT_607831 [Xylariaceae sp. FL0662B]|nr:hypothetical protein F4779DRAFT_607831 [Xylariaceae sp. FL0662B]
MEELERLQRLQPILKFLVKIFGLTKRGTPFSNRLYLEEKDLCPLGITISGLDFYSGEPRDDGQIFIKPLPYKRMDKLLKQCQPWSSYYDCPTIPSESFHSDKIWQARDIWNVLQSYLRLNKDPNGPGAMDKTGWKMIMPPGAWKTYQATETSFWCVDSMLERDESDDPPKPHITCFLADRAPLKDMVLSMSEFKAIRNITAGCLKGGYTNTRQHKIIPITFVTGAGYDFRITQAYMDGDKERIFIRMTPIINFTKGEKEMEKEFISTLCWLVGEPVGTTTLDG